MSGCDQYDYYDNIMVKKQSLGNPQFHIRIDRRLLARAEEKLGGRQGVADYIKSQFASEFNASTSNELQPLKDLGEQSLALASKTADGIGGLIDVLKIMNQHLEKLEVGLKKIEGDQGMTQRAILLLAERLGMVDARGSGSPKEG